MTDATPWTEAEERQARERWEHGAVRLADFDRALATLAAVRQERDRLRQKYEQYRDVWLERGFPVKDGDTPDAESTVIGLNSRLLLAEARVAAFTQERNALRDDVRALAEALQRALDSEDPDEWSQAAFKALLRPGARAALARPGAAGATP
jgi:hypothetical protein